MEALQVLDISERSGDEELVAVVENDACGIDALQFLAGCTFGKGNLIFRNWGKMAFTLIRRDIQNAVRVSIRNDLNLPDTFTRDQKIDWILTAPVQKLLRLDPVTVAMPGLARRSASVECSKCGELTMETRTVATNHDVLCIPCARLSELPHETTDIAPETLIDMLQLKPLPEEDGLFSEVYRSSEIISGDALPERYNGDRACATAIYYMLLPGIESRMHRVKSDEIFHLYAGGPVKMTQQYADGSQKEIVIGDDFAAGQRPMVVVPHGVWQGMRLMPGATFALFGCTVAPGFDFDDFELAASPFFRLFP